MDQALKSALDKYNGKLGITAPIDKSGMFNKVTLAIAIVIAVVLVFSVCVRYDFLLAGEAWERIKNISVGDQSVGALIDGIEERVSAVFSSEEETIAPVNANGESSSIQMETTP